jgi:hypothetical protein
MQYKVIYISSAFSIKRTLEKLIKEVNDAITEGWEPQGGVTLLGTNLLQALIKRR